MVFGCFIIFVVIVEGEVYLVILDEFEVSIECIYFLIDLGFDLSWDDVCWSFNKVYW